MHRVKGSGRRLSLDNDTIHEIEKIIKVDNKITAKKMAEIVEESTNICVSQWTVSRVMRNLGYKSRVPAFKPLLMPRHLEARFDLANKWSMWPKKRFSKYNF